MLYGATITLSAFLLFVVQPTIAKQILPWFGGAAAVWTTCMVFFQAVLLAGYAYSDWMTRRLTLRRQTVVHVSLLAVSLLALPIVAPPSLKPQADTEPSIRILALLAVTIGLPYFLLSTTGPLVQAWFARRYAGDRVYRLYALSNVASMLALAAYPALIEPFMPARLQAVAWSWGYAAFAALAAAAVLVTLRLTPSSGAVSDRDEAPRPGATTVGEPGGGELTRPRSLAILALAALASTLLLAITAHMTRDVASIPFLWMVPLLLYLLSFVLCFDGERWYSRAVFVPLAAALVVAMLATEWFRRMDLRLSLPVHALGLFAACMVCHGEIAARRPAPRLLTRFYLMISLGGAAGGLFVGIVAPLVFPAPFELPLALCALALAIYLTAPGRLRFAGALALLAAAGLTTLTIRGTLTNTVARSRNFYGTLRVTRTTPADPAAATLRLSHGAVLHGEQYVSRAQRRSPTSYYGTTSGIGRTLALLRTGPIRMGVVGLGTGTLAAYGEPGDHLRFYELDPDVERYARSLFHFLEDSAATTEVAIGDARLTLEREARQDYDVIVVDAFSSDAIPVHLLTREAMEIYRRHLRDDGTVAFHVSNRYLDLAPVVAELARASGMRARLIQDRPEDTSVLSPSLWVIATRNDALLERFAAERVGEEIPSRDRLRIWTDDYSNLLGVVQFARAGEPR